MKKKFLYLLSVFLLFGCFGCSVNAMSVDDIVTRFKSDMLEEYKDAAEKSWVIENTGSSIKVTDPMGYYSYNMDAFYNENDGTIKYTSIVPSNTAELATCYENSLLLSMILKSIAGLSNQDTSMIDDWLLYSDSINLKDNGVSIEYSTEVTGSSLEENGVIYIKSIEIHYNDFKYDVKDLTPKVNINNTSDGLNIKVNVDSYNSNNSNISIYRTDNEEYTKSSPVDVSLFTKVADLDFKDSVSFVDKDVNLNTTYYYIVRDNTTNYVSDVVKITYTKSLVKLISNYDNSNDSIKILASIGFIALLVAVLVIKFVYFKKGNK